MGLQQGVEKRDSAKVTYLNLHSGQLSRTMSEKYVVKNGLQDVVATWRKYTTKNKADEVFTYYAEDYPRITGYVTGLKYFSKPLGDTTKTGYHLYVDCGDAGVFCIEITPNDRFAYRSFMSIAMNIDFKKICQFTAFTNKADWQIFVAWQENEAGEVETVKAKYRELWLSQLTISKIKEKLPLDEKEAKSVVLKEDGSVDTSYPYVRQKKNPTTQLLEWNFDKWQEHLNDEFERIVIPNVAEAVAELKANAPIATAIAGDTSFNTDEFEDDDLPAFSGTPLPDVPSGDDIPF